MNYQAYAFLAGYLNKTAGPVPPQAAPNKKWSMKQIQDFLSANNFPWENVRQAAVEGSGIPFAGAVKGAYDAVSSQRGEQESQNSILNSLKKSDAFDRKHNILKGPRLGQADKYQQELTQDKTLARKPN